MISRWYFLTQTITTSKRNETIIIKIEQFHFDSYLFIGLVAVPVQPCASLCLVSPKGEGWIIKTSLTLSLFIEMSVPSHDSQRSYIYIYIYTSEN